jgi:predicted glycogen debranching enzyme
MDAKIGDWVVTPRSGKPVEIQALWYNALCIMANLAARFGEIGEQKRYSGMASQARESFNRIFWNSAGQCLCDEVSNGRPEA